MGKRVQNALGDPKIIRGRKEVDKYSLGWHRRGHLPGVAGYQDLISKGLVKLPRKGGRIYELFSSRIPAAAEIPPEYTALETVLKGKGYIKNEDIRMVLGVSRRQAVRMAGKLVDQGMLKVSGGGRERRYLPGS